MLIVLPTVGCEIPFHAVPARAGSVTSVLIKKEIGLSVPCVAFPPHPQEPERELAPINRKLIIAVGPVARLAGS